MPFNELTAVNLVAAQERSISGVRNSFGYAQNPDNLVSSMLPAVVHYFPRFDIEPWAHHNVWKNTLILRSILFVSPREAAGGKLKFLENAAIPFGNLWRTHFQQDTVISGLLSGMGATKFWLISGEYGVGGTELTFGATEYIGWAFSWEIQSA